MTGKDKQKQEYLARIGDCLTVFTSDAGKRVLKDMRSRYRRNIFDPDPCTMAKNVGKCEVVDDIEAMIVAGKSPQQLEDLFKEPEDEGWVR